MSVPPLSLGGVLGEGGVATVFSARDDRGALVAVKVARADAPKANERLASEAAMLRQVGAPLVPAVLAEGLLDDGRRYLVMEQLEQPSLAEVLERAQGPLPTDRALALGRALVRVVGELHQRGFIHLDLKPENVFVDEVGCTARLIDLGLARKPGESAQPGFAGTPEYMAPEQRDERAPLAAATDVYALGIILYELVTGRPPFIGPDNDVFRAHRELRPRAPSALAPLSSELEAVILRCLEKRPARRYADAHALASALPESDAGAAAPRAATAAKASASKKKRVGLVFVRGPALGEKKLLEAVGRLGAGLVHVEATRAVLAFDTLDSEWPLAAALRAAETLCSASIAVAARVDVASVVASPRPGGGLRFVSALFTQDARYPTADERGVLATAEAAFLLSRSQLEADPAGPGLLRVLPSDLGERTRTRVGGAALGPTFGRESLVEQLLASAAQCQERRVQTQVQVMGEVGFGKTHLFAHLAERLRFAAPHLSVLELRAVEPVGGSRSDNLARLLRFCLGLPPTGAEVERERWGEVFSVLEPALWPAAAAGLGWLSPASDELAQVAAAPGALRAFLARAAGEVLRAVAGKRPLAVLLDDAHFAEDLVLDALDYGCAGAALPLWVCAFARPAFRQSRPTYGEAAPSQAALELSPLSAADAQSLLALLLRPAEHVPTKTLEELAGRCAGVPLLLTELAFGLKRSGAVRRRQDSAASYLAVEELGQIPELPLVQWLAERELATLRPELVGHARLVSQLGLPLRPDEVAGVLRQLDAEGHAADYPLDAEVGLERLVETGLLVSSRSGLSFRHALVREAIARAVPEAQQKSIHQAAFRYFESLLPLSVARAHCAFHAARAGFKDRAALLSLELAREAARRQEYARADGMCTAALDNLGPDEASRQLEARHLRGAMRFRQGQHETAVADFVAARALAVSLGRTEELVELLLEEGTAYDWMNNYVASRERVDQAGQLLAPLSSASLWARYRVGRGRAQWRFSRWKEAVPDLEEAARAAATLGDAEYETRIVALLVLGLILPNVGRADEGGAVLDEALRLTEQHQDRLHLSVMLNNRRGVRTARGDVAGAIADQRENIRIGSEFGARLPIYYGEFNLGEICHQAGRVDEAKLHVERAVDFERAHRDFCARPVALLLKARLFAANGELDEARAAMREVREREAEAKALGRAEGELVPNEKALAEAVELRLRAAPDAQWEPALALSREVSVEQDPLEILYLCASCALARGDEASAASRIEQALAQCPDIPNFMEPRLRALRRRPLSDGAPGRLR